MFVHNRFKSFAYNIFVFFAAIGVLDLSILSIASEAEAKAKATVIHFHGDVSKREVDQLIARVEQASGRGDKDIVIDLTSLGGDLQVALRAFHTLRSLHVQTHVSDECSSACTVLFASGDRRTAVSSATFLFHRVGVIPAQRGVSRQQINDYRTQFAAEWLSAIGSVSPSLANELESRKTLVSGSRTYTGAELRYFGFVTN